MRKNNRLHRPDTRTFIFQLTAAIVAGFLKYVFPVLTNPEDEEARRLFYQINLRYKNNSNIFAS
ncbi:MAG: hypothetical protein B6D39_12795 [Anaerolineae bacterium UTCFX2]|jgi:CO dehydrogenase/acetyl-CoA synthase alpha subunit|nr:MAG: hypothetical protein B6D39_12795 [Anaerolineae bacterium UTCFX2]